MLQGLTVLLADDSLAARQVGEAMLQAMGARPILAADGAEALALIAAEAVDVAVLDLGMPRISGREAIRLLRADPAIGPRLAIVAFSGSVNEGVRAELRGIGADAVLAKPVLSLKDFSDAILRARASPVSGIDAVDPAPIQGAPGVLALERLRGAVGEDAIGRVLASILRDLEEIERRAAASVASGDADALRAAAHDATSLAGVIGATALEGMARRLTSAATTDILEEISSDAGSFKRELGSVLRELRVVVRG